MALSNKTDALADRVGAAACAAWWSFIVGALLASALGVVYLVVIHTPLREVVSAIWDFRAVPVVFITFLGLLKLFLTVWALGCIFLTMWARRLRQQCGTE